VIFLVPAPAWSAPGGVVGVNGSAFLTIVDNDLIGGRTGSLLAS